MRLPFCVNSVKTTARNTDNLSDYMGNVYTLSNTPSGDVEVRLLGWTDDGAGVNVCNVDDDREIYVISWDNALLRNGSHLTYRRHASDPEIAPNTAIADGNGYVTYTPNPEVLPLGSYVTWDEKGYAYKAESPEVKACQKDGEQFFNIVEMMFNL